MQRLDLKNKFCQLKDTKAIFQFTGSIKPSVNGNAMYKVKLVDGDTLIGTAWVLLDEIIILNDSVVNVLYKSK